MGWRLERDQAGTDIEVCVDFEHVLHRIDGGEILSSAGEVVEFDPAVEMARHVGVLAHAAERSPPGTSELVRVEGVEQQAVAPERVVIELGQVGDRVDAELAQGAAAQAPIKMQAVKLAGQLATAVAIEGEHVGPLPAAGIAGGLLVAETAAQEIFSMVMIGQPVGVVAFFFGGEDPVQSKLGVARVHAVVLGEAGQCLGRRLGSCRRWRKDG